MERKTTLVSRPIKSVMLIYIFLVVASPWHDSSACEMDPYVGNVLKDLKVGYIMEHHTVPKLWLHSAYCAVTQQVFAGSLVS